MAKTRVNQCRPSKYPGAVPEIFIWGYSSGDLRNGSPPVGCRDEAPVVVWGRSPSGAEAVCIHCLETLTAETIKI